MVHGDGHHEVFVDRVFAQHPRHTDQRSDHEIGPAGVVSRWLGIFWVVQANQIRAAVGHISESTLIAKVGFTQWADFRLRRPGSGPSQRFQPAHPVRAVLPDDNVALGVVLQVDPRKCGAFQRVADVVHHEVVSVTPALHVVARIGRKPVMEKRLVRDVPAHSGIERNPPRLEEEGHSERLPERRFQIKFCRWGRRPGRHLRRTGQRHCSARRFARPVTWKRRVGEIRRRSHSRAQLRNWLVNLHVGVSFRRILGRGLRPHRRRSTEHQGNKAAQNPCKGGTESVSLRQTRHVKLPQRKFHRVLQRTSMVAERRESVYKNPPARENEEPIW